jgi:hypothetical protein
MKKSLLTFSIVSIFLLSGCVPYSVNPVYTEDDIIYNPDLVGTWAEKDSDEKYIFSEIDERYYNLIIMNEGVIEGIFTTHLARIDDTMFLDLSPEFGTPYGDGFFKDHFAILHSFFLVHEIDSALTISMLNYEWLKEYLKLNPNEISYEIINGRITFTAPTKDVQAFLIKHLDTEDAYDEPGALLRE